MVIDSVFILKVRTASTELRRNFIKVYSGYTRGDQKVRGKKLPFLRRLINRTGITAPNTATHMQLIGYNVLGVTRLHALQRSSRQRYVAQTGPFYVAF